MKLIGVTGRPGAGKTTFSEMLASHPDMGLIHVDDLVRDIKYKYFKLFLKRDKDNNIQKCGATLDDPKLKNGAKKFFYSNKYTFGFLIWIRNTLTRRSLNQKLQEYEMQGKKAVVIDNWVLSKNKKLYDHLDKIYYIDRNFCKRREGLRKRDNLDLIEMKIADMPHALGLIHKPKDTKLVTVINRGTLESLQQKANLERKKLGILTIQEKYSERNKPSRVVTPLRTNTPSKNQKDIDYIH